MINPSDISSSVDIIKIPIGFVENVWPHIEKWIEQALKVAPPWYTLDGLRGRTLNGRFSMFVAARNNIPLGVSLVEIERYDKALICSVPWIGGKWFPQMQTEIEAWARSCGATWIIGYGRKGWIRKAKMKQIGIILAKEI